MINMPLTDPEHQIKPCLQSCPWDKKPAMLRRVGCSYFLPCCCRYRESLFEGHWEQSEKGRRIDDAYNNNKHCSFLLLEHLLPPSVQAHPLCSTPAAMGPEAPPALKPRQTWPRSKAQNKQPLVIKSMSCTSTHSLPVYCWVKQILGTIRLSIWFRYRQRDKRNSPSTQFVSLAL